MTQGQTDVISPYRGVLKGEYFEITDEIKDTVR
jgi:hypothetical protein